MNTSKLYELFKSNEEQFKACENYYLMQFYEEAFGMVKEEIAKEAEKSAGRKPNVRNAVKQFLGDDTRPVLKRANIMDIDGVTYYGYCDGFKLAWSPIDFGFGVNTPEESLKFGNIINVTYSNKGTIPVDDKFKTDLAMFLKTHKRSERMPYDIQGENGYTIRVNPYYLKACLDFTEATEIIVDFDSQVKPLVMYGKEDRNALCLPIRR